jgi:serine protease Do
MIVRVLGVAAVVLVVAGAGPPLALAQNQASVASQSAAIEAALARVAPSLVRIHVVTVSHNDGREIKREASGSGTIITPEGHVVTNHHVAGKTRTIVCTLPTREEVPADLVGTDPLSDIAVLKLRPATPRTFPVAKFGDASKLKVGDRVLALGSPLALSQSVTMGIVSNTEMIMPGLFWPFNRLKLDGEDVGSIVRWIGHDAAIFGGNSGGPLVNMQGEIVGVNEISMGLAGAIPADLAQEVANALIQEGRVRRGWIGLEVQPLLKSSTAKKGALIGGTIEGSPAAKAGFASGDILLELDGRDVAVRFAEEVPPFNQFVMRLPPGKPVDAVVLRDGQRKTISVTPHDRESVEAPVREITPLGITGSNLTSWTAKELRRASTSGVHVRGIRPGAAADDAKPSLQDGDVIVSLDGEPVKDVESLIDTAERIVRGRTEPLPVLVAFDRKTERMLTVLELARPGLQDPGMEARKAWIPVSVQALTPELAEKLGVPGRRGVRVTRVFGGSATAAGLQVADLILAIDGDPVEASQPSEAEVFETMIRQYKIGGTVTLTTIRGKDERLVKVQLQSSPRLPREMKKYEDPNFEFRVRDVAEMDRAQLTVPAGDKGVLVEAVREGGWAALAHLGDGDVILAVDGEPVPDVAALKTKMESIANAKPSSVVMHVRRELRTFFVEMQTGWEQKR